MGALSREDEWLWGWDPTPGIVSVWAQDAQAIVWRRDPRTHALIREDEHFRPWMLLERLDDLTHVGGALRRDASNGLAYRVLEGPGALRYLVSADDTQSLTAPLFEGASRRLGRAVRHVRDLEGESIVFLPPEEQYLVATGRTYFRDLSFDELHRLQFDLETTGLDARRDRIFMISVRHADGRLDVLESGAPNDAAEAELIRQLVETIRASDPDSIENHNLHGFDLPFLDARARRLRVPLAFGRAGPPGLRQRAARRGLLIGEGESKRRVRFMAPGRELIDTIDAVRRFDQGVRELPSYGLKAVARQLGIAPKNREYIPGAEIYRVYCTDPERVRRYATHDVEEVAALSRLIGGASFALAQMAPRRYERLADTGAATGVIDPLLLRAYVHVGVALPAHQPGDGTPHAGAALRLYASGVAHHVVKADVASLYPSLMRAFRIGPARDTLGVLLSLVDRLVELRLRAKADARTASPGSPDRFRNEAMSAAMKMVINSAYGYLAAGGDLTRFADVHAANEVTRRGRETLDLMCRELAARGVTLIEADTDGVYFAVPDSWNEADEQRVVAEVGALLPPLVQLELEGRYAAMLSHEPKNYALLRYDGSLILRGVAFRSSRAEPFGEKFLRHVIARLLVDDVVTVHRIYLDTVDALRRREISTYDVSSRVRLTKTPSQYLASRMRRKELPYEALLNSGRQSWGAGDRVRVYRNMRGEPSLVEIDEEGDPASDPRDYDAEHYVCVLRENFATRLARAFTPEDFEAVFGDPDQTSMFQPPIDGIRPILSSSTLRSAEPPRVSS